VSAWLALCILFSWSLFASGYTIFGVKRENKNIEASATARGDNRQRFESPNIPFQLAVRKQGIIILPWTFLATALRTEHTA
jgi:hypothetical protein